MFLNYQNIADNYTPNNLMCSFPIGKSYTKLAPVQASKPYEEYDAHGNLIGYFWRYGETVNLEFNIDGEITVENNALIFTQSGQTPVETEGALGLRAYNIVDKYSWTCTNIVNNRFIWTQDSEFTYDESSNNSVYVLADDYLADKQIEFTLSNFRHEVIHKRVYAGASKIIVDIDTELSSKLFKGIYYCSLTVYDNTVRLPIFSNTDCTLLVK